MSRGSAPRLARVGQHRNRIELGNSLTSDVKGGFFKTQTWRADVPEHPLLQVSQVVYANSVWFGQHTPVTGDCDVDYRALVGQRRFQAQRRRSRVKHCGPGSLQPGQRSGVIHVYAVVDPRPLVAPEQPSNVMLLQPRIQCLPTRDHPRLLPKHVLDVHAIDARPPATPRPDPFRVPVDNYVC